VLALPFRVFGAAARAIALPRAARPLLESAARSEARACRSIAPSGRASPLCRWPLPRLCGISSAGCAGVISETGRDLSASFAFLESLAQQNLADQPQPVSSSLGLSFPTAHEAAEVYSARALPARYVPPAGFGYPLGGLLPLRPCRFCFAPAALVGFALRSLILAKGIRRVSARMSPRTVSLGSYPSAVARAGPPSRGSWVLTLSGVP